MRLSMFLIDQAIKNDKPIDKNLIRVLNELSI